MTHWYPLSQILTPLAAIDRNAPPAATLASLRSHWSTLASLVTSRQLPSPHTNPTHAQALAALCSHPLARSKFLQALRNTLIYDFDQAERPQLVNLLSRATGVERLIKGLVSLQAYQQAWLDLLDAPSDVRQEFGVAFQAQLVGMMDPGLERYLARFVLVTAGGSYSVPISVAEANRVRSELGLPLLDPAAHRASTCPNPNVNLTHLHSLSIFPLVLPSLLAETKRHINALIHDLSSSSASATSSSSSSSTETLATALTPRVLTHIHTQIFPRLAYCLCPSLLSPMDLYRDLLFAAAHEVLRVRGRSMQRVIPLGVDACPGAVNDVQACSGIGTQIMRTLIVAPTAAWIREKVLVASKPTHDILRVFISGIQVFRAIEGGAGAATNPAVAVNKGTVPLFHALVEEMKRYLRGRDAVQDLVALVFPMEGAGGMVAEEGLLEGGEIKMETEESRYLVVLDESLAPGGDGHAVNEWVDKPRVPAAASLPQGIPRDTLSILMNIYPAKDVFAHTYQTRLTEVLLSDCDANLTNLWRIVNQLARRMGRKDMGKCLAMVRDAIDSRAVNDRIQHPIVHPLVISSEVWPSEWSRAGHDEEEEKKVGVLKLHPELKQLADDYTSQFTSQSPMHSLAFYPHTGSVTLEFAFDTDDLPPVTIACTPDQATTMLHFADQPEWTRDALVDAMRLPPQTVRSLVYFWIRRGLVEHMPGRPGAYRAATERPSAAALAHMRALPAATTTGGHTDEWGNTAAGGGADDVDVDQQSAETAPVDILADVLPAVLANWTVFARVGLGRSDDLKELQKFMLSCILGQNKPTAEHVVAVLERLVEAGEVDKVADERVEGGWRYVKKVQPATPK